MEQWWASMSALEHVYWLIAVASTTVLAAQLILAMVSGFEFHVGDVHDTQHDVPGFHLLTVRNVVGFFAVMSWTGLTFYNQKMATPIVILLSILCGFIMMMCMAGIFFGLSRLESDGTFDIKTAIGKNAMVYLLIPSKRKGHGVISISTQGRRTEINAYTDDDDSIMTGSTVKIKEIINGIAIVERG